MSSNATILASKTFVQEVPKQNAVKSPVKPVPYVVPRPRKKRQSRIKGVHLLVMGGAVLVLIAQILTTHMKLTELHYQIEDLNYENKLISVEKDSYYQHQAELSQLSRLKSVVEEAGLVLDSSKVVQITE